jgi:hypothetical protein
VLSPDPLAMASRMAAEVAQIAASNPSHQVEVNDHLVFL